MSLNQLPGAKGTKLYAVGSSRGSKIVTNDDLAGPIDSSDEWIRQRTGIIVRRRAAEGENATTFAIDAAKKAIVKSKIPAEKIDLVICASITNSVPTPSMASLVAYEVGAFNAAAYDISAACAGYTYAIAQADALIRAGSANYALVIGSESISQYTDPTDRSISFLLGDGAGAVIVGPSDEIGISPTVWGSDGSNWKTIRMTNTITEYRDAKGKLPWPTLRQDGATVFRWAVWEMVKVAKEVLEKSGISVQDLGAFIPHQANMRIIDEFAKQLKLPETVVIARDIAEMGNSSAASIPIAMDALLDAHPNLKGSYALQIGFGAGLVFGAQIVKLPELL